MIGRARLLVLASLLAASTVGSADPRQPTSQEAPKAQTERKIKLPSVLSEPVRELLRARMRWHAAELGDLVYSVVTLDYRTAHTLANAIISDATLTRPSIAKEAAQLEAQLPARFFVLQDRLKQACLQLAVASDRHDGKAAGTAIGQITSTCVQCHAVFFKDAASPTR